MDENSVEFNIGFKYSNDEKNTLNGVDGNIKKADAHASAARAAVGNRPYSGASFTWFRNFMRASIGEQYDRGSFRIGKHRLVSC